MATNRWLVKCEPHECSFDELKTRPRRTGYWRGVRNYQARNLIRDEMAKGDLAFFYHSNCAEPGIAGIVEIAHAGYPDPSQFDKSDRYYDAKSSAGEPRWYSFDVKWKQRGLGCGSLMIADEKLLILSEKGELVVAKASGESFEELARSKFLTGRCWTVPVLLNGKVYGRNAVGRLVCVELPRN